MQKKTLNAQQPSALKQSVLLGVILLGCITSFALSSTSFAQPVPATQAEQAAQDFALGNTDNACKQFNSLAKANPGLVEAQYGLALCARSDRKNDKAISLLNSTLANAPDYAPAHLLLAEILDEVGRRDEADAHYKKYGTLLKSTGLGCPKSPQLRLRLRQLGVY